MGESGRWRILTWGKGGRGVIPSGALGGMVELGRSYPQGEMVRGTGRNEGREESQHEKEENEEEDIVQRMMMMMMMMMMMTMMMMIMTMMTMTMVMMIMRRI